VERPVKERLVGAAVLMAAAIILIPEMLSGPDRGSAGQNAQRGEGAIKTYTIDLSQPPGSAPALTTEADNNRAPPPEETAVPPTAAPPPEPSSPEVFAESPLPASPQQDDSSPIVAETPAPPPPTRTESPPPKAQTPPPRPVASEPAVPTSPTRAASGWAVQVGSYSSEATAERLMNEWRAKGLDAFVMPVKSGGKTLYRVRIGPTADRAGAEAALKVVKPSVPAAAVVAHP
jgi:DedD protein